MDEAAIWSELGPRGFRLLVAAFYRRIPGDELLGPMYPSEDLGGSEDRLYDFLCFRFGGGCPATSRNGAIRVSACAIDRSVSGRSSATVGSS